MIYCSICNKKIEKCNCKRSLEIETKVIEKLEKKKKVSKKNIEDKE